MVYSQVDSEETPAVPEPPASIITPVPFVEIHLSSEGVFGIDSKGNEWDYDFSTEQFVNEQIDRRRTESIFRQEELAERAERLSRELENLEVPEIPEDIAGQAQQLRKFKGTQLGKVLIDEDEIVEGTVAAFGEVLVKGVVNGDVISYKRITVTATGIINGDARAPEIVRMRGGLISGKTIETSGLEIPDFPLFEQTSYTELTVFSIILISLLFFGLLASAIIPRQLGNVSLCIKTGFVRSFFVGLGIWFALGPLIVLLTLTIIGIPVAAFVLPIALVLGLLVGIIGFSLYTGEKLQRHVPLIGDSILGKILVGLVALYIFWMLMSLFAIRSGGGWNFLYILFMVISIIIWSFVTCTGLGAVVLTRFGFRDCTKMTRGQYRVSVEVGSVAPQPPTPPPPPPQSVPPPPPTPPPLKEDHGENARGG